MVRCPYCGFEGNHVLLKKWKYRWWDVLYYQCIGCDGRFRLQVDPEGRRKSYVIKVKRRA